MAFEEFESWNVRMELIGRTFRECVPLLCVSSRVIGAILACDESAICVRDADSQSGRFLFFYDSRFDVLRCYQVFFSSTTGTGSLVYLWSDYCRTNWEYYFDADDFEKDFVCQFRIHQLQEHIVTQRTCNSLLIPDVSRIICNYVTFRKTQAQVAIVKLHIQNEYQKAKQRIDQKFAAKMKLLNV